MKNIDRIRSDVISYIKSASADEIYNLLSLLRDSGYNYEAISSYLIGCDKCEMIYGPCGDSDLATDHCRNMFLRYCEDE